MRRAPLRHCWLRLRPLHTTSGLPITSKFVKTMIQEASALAQPDSVYVCDGSDDEAAVLIRVRSVGVFFTTEPLTRFPKMLVATGTLEPLAKRPNSYLARSDPRDVARVEKQTYICSERQEDAGWLLLRSARVVPASPTINWTQGPTTTGRSLRR